MPDLHIEQWPVERLRPYANNPRKNDHVVDRMVGSLKEFGFRVPVLARADGEIIDGHLRYKAALAMGMTTVPVIPADDMTEGQIRAFRILINRSATWAEWDDELLLQELSKLCADDVDLTLTGFDDRELDRMLKEMEGNGKDPDAVPPAPEVPHVRRGEVWLLGRHRLMCGDGTSEADCLRLLGDARLDMIWTDPPYNVGYESGAGKIQNDKLPAAEFDAFLLALHQSMFAALRPGGAIYVAHSEAGSGMAFRRAFAGAGFYLATCLVWRKSSVVLGRSDYQFQHEPILYGWRRGAAHRWYGDRKQRSVMDAGIDGLVRAEDGSWQFNADGRQYRLTGADLQVEEIPTTVIDAPKPARSELHPTMKPVELIERMMLNSSPRDGLVGDFCGGSGSTLMACERLGRAARIMEIDPRYAEVIIRRWQDYTEGTAAREGDGKTLAELEGESM